MKKAMTFIITVLVCLMLPVSAFAKDLYVVDDWEEKYDPVVQTTTAKPAETTTSLRDAIGDIIGSGNIDEYIDKFAGSLGNGIDSILSGLPSVDNYFGNNSAQTTSVVPVVQTTEKQTYSSSVTTAPSTTLPAQTVESTTAPDVQNGNAAQEVNTVLIVNSASDQSGLSGSTLTLIIFIAAIVLLILGIVFVLVFMTRRTEFNSAVMKKSTIPSVDSPKTLAQFVGNDIDDGKNYDDIAYWND